MAYTRPRTMASRSRVLTPPASWAAADNREPEDEGSQAQGQESQEFIDRQVDQPSDDDLASNGPNPERLTLGSFVDKYGMVVSRCLLPEVVPQASRPGPPKRSLTQELSALSTSRTAGCKFIDDNEEMQQALRKYTEKDNRPLNMEAHGIKGGKVWGTCDVFNSVAFFELPASSL